MHRVDGLAPDSDHERFGIAFRTLARPAGELLCRFATVNDVHFGEIEAGRIDDDPNGPIRRAAPGAEPYPEVMNHTAVAEMAAIEPGGRDRQGRPVGRGDTGRVGRVRGVLPRAFGERLKVVRGNHDAYQHQDAYAGDQWIELPGVTVALLDTAIPGATTGMITTEQFEWLDDHAASTDAPVFVMGHHQQWIGGRRRHTQRRLLRTASRRQRCARRGLRPRARTSSPTRPATRTATASGRWPAPGVPSIEVGCTKDFPGTWAEYRVFEGGIMQVVHRMSSPEALAWSESCRHLYSDFGIDYETYALGSLADRCFVIPLR